MLFIDYDEEQVRKAHAVFDQRVRADDDVDRSRGERLPDRVFLAGGHGTGQQLDVGHPPRLARCRDGVMPREQQFRNRHHVLPREHFRRDHKRHLAAVRKNVRRHRDRDERFTGAHVAFEEPRHRTVLLHVSQYFVDRDLLVIGRREVQRREETLDDVRVHRNLQPVLRGLAPGFATFQRVRLHAEHLFERHPLACALHGGRVFRKVQRFQRLATR